MMSLAATEQAIGFASYGPGRPGRLSGISVFRRKPVLCGDFVWARRALTSQKRRCPARAAVGALAAEVLHQLGVGGRGSNAAPYTFYVAALCSVYSALLPLTVRGGPPAAGRLGALSVFPREPIL
jgi:hypothetical protein